MILRASKTESFTPRKGGSGSNHLVTVNIGCGQSPTQDWINFDNSPSVRLAGHIWLAKALARLGIMKKEQLDFVEFLHQDGTVRWADASRRIPLSDGSARALYSSHMIGYLDGRQLDRFLSEVRRILAPGGLIRICVPDLRGFVQDYLTDGDADRLIQRTLLVRVQPRGFLPKMRYAIIGDRIYRWMYDGPSLCRRLSAAGFREPKILPAGETQLEEPGCLNLYEQQEESVYVEARKP